MFFSVFSLFLFIRRKTLFTWVSVAKDVELFSIDPPINPNPSNNITELLLEKNANQTTFFQPNSSAGMDMRVSPGGVLLRLETIRRNIAKKAMISFLEDPNQSDLNKQDKIMDPASTFLFDEKNDSSLCSFRMEAGGFWKDWDDAIFLLL